LPALRKILLSQELCGMAGSQHLSLASPAPAAMARQMSASSVDQPMLMALSRQWEDVATYANCLVASCRIA
ncbi:hypothetical protein H4S02_009197, partial [Coemansia sp. RSA 2611]